VLSSGCIVLYYTLDDQLFLQPRPVHHSEQCLSYKNYTLAKSAYLTENTKHDKITAVAKRFRNREPHKQHNSTTMIRSRTHFYSLGVMWGTCKDAKENEIPYN